MLTTRAGKRRRGDGAARRNWPPGLFDRGFRTAADLQRVLSLPVLSAIPRMDGNGERGVPERRRAQKLLLAIAIGLVVWALQT